MEVMVFKTNLRSKSDLHAVSRQLDALEYVAQWTVDLQDIDKVLRVESPVFDPPLVEESLKRAGYWCKEMED